MTSSDSECEFTFGEGIEYALQEISIDSQDRQIFTRDAQTIQNAFIQAISRYDPTFKNAFRGLSLGGSFLDDIRIELPDEFDMHVKIVLPFEVEPIRVSNYPGYVFLRVGNRYARHHCIQTYGADGKFINRELIQTWFRTNISAVMNELQNIRCGNRSYSLKYTAHGYGVAHTLVATERRRRHRKIYFDFVPVFEFEACEWPRHFSRVPNAGRTWLAVPRKYMGKNVNDSRSFMVCAPHWERLVLHKKQNLKDSLRLMKAFRNANDMPHLVSYMIKTLYLNAVEERKTNWNQAPGRILIRLMVELLMDLLDGFQEFYLAPDHNNFSNISREEIQEYKRIVGRTLKKLISRRNADYLTWDDLSNFFGVEC
ncbi:uncharacterized protein LOC115622453 [Scaptodrosophila lebanonensis]|uniref:Uncharacterized protein LOC115622453 n=1 Tax=Drosophila lebanonensis TaxID=7225 RepID=A0A6J2T5Q9_DROLE|nr:uncharacterized protein LOC115622453 [Scaptodrosophila lebanonensis]